MSTFIRLAILTLLLLPLSCRGSSGGGPANLTAGDLNATWLISLTIVGQEGGGCSVEPVGSSETTPVVVTVNGNNVTLTTDDGSPFDLELRGSRVQGTILNGDPGGLSSETTIDFGLAGGLLDGSVTEIIRDALIPVCSTTSSLTGIRQAVPAANFGGAWTITTQTTSSTCAGGMAMEVTQGQFEQTGNILTINDAEGALTGTILGNTVTLTREDVFTSITLTMVPAGDAFFGSGQVRITDNGTACERSILVSAVRFVAASTTAKAWIDFDSGLIDASGNGLNGSPNGDFTIVSGAAISGTQFGSFDGDGDRVDLANSALLNVSDAPYTVSVWVNPAEVNGSHVIWQKGPADGSNTTNNPTLLLSQGFLFFDLYFVGNTNGTVTLPLNEWSNVVVTYDGATTYNLYLNGILAAATSFLTGANEGQNVEGPWVFTIGEGLNSFSDKDFVGSIDDLVFWQRALTTGEIQALVANGPIGI